MYLYHWDKLIRELLSLRILAETYPAPLDDIPACDGSLLDETKRLDRIPVIEGFFMKGCLLGPANHQRFKFSVFNEMDR